MLFLLSPAKTLDYDTPLTEAAQAAGSTAPIFEGPRSPASELIGLLRERSPQQIAELMHLSGKLSTLNVARYLAWKPKSTEKNARPAALAFAGDVYGGLDAPSLTTTQLRWAQERICILSGLYGVLRPLDRLQPYRLEMGTALPNRHGANLVAFWGDRIARQLDEKLAGTRSPVVVNLASQEYFKAVDRKALQARVVDCVFQESKNGQHKVLGFFAKRARGLMARWAIVHKAGTPERLRGFDLEGYAYAEAASSDDRLVFRRRQP